MSEERIRKYETVVVTRSDADHEAQRKLHESLTGLMEQSGVKPIRFEYWGKRRLAYQIKKAGKGIYYYHVYLGGSAFLAEMNRLLKLSSIVLRYMTVMLDDGVNPETYDFEGEQHFDTLPTESEVKKDRDRHRTGWDEEFSSGAADPDKKDESGKDKTGDKTDDESTEGDKVEESDAKEPAATEEAEKAKEAEKTEAKAGDGNDKEAEKETGDVKADDKTEEE